MSAANVPLETRVPGTLTVEVADPKFTVFAPVAAVWMFRLPVRETESHKETMPVVVLS